MFYFLHIGKEDIALFPYNIEEKKYLGRDRKLFGGALSQKGRFCLDLFAFFLDLTNLHFFISYEIWKYLGHCFGTHRIQIGKKNKEKKTR